MVLVSMLDEASSGTVTSHQINLSVRYNFDIAESTRLGLYWDIYNLTNNENLRNPTGRRTSASFLIPRNANFPRQMQFGVRFSF